MPENSHNGNLGEILAQQFPSLLSDALLRVQSGKNIFVSRHKLPPGFTPEYGRLVLMRALGVFSEITNLPAERFHLFADERELLNPVIKGHDET